MKFFPDAERASRAMCIYLSHKSGLQMCNVYFYLGLVTSYVESVTLFTVNMYLRRGRPLPAAARPTLPGQLRSFGSLATSIVLHYVMYFLRIVAPSYLRARRVGLV